MANNTTTIKFVGQFDSSGITKGLQDIKKQVTNANISEDLKKQFETAFNKLQVNIPALEKLTSKEDFNLKDIEALQKLLKEVTKDWENLNKVTDQIDLSKTFSAKDLEKINNLDKQIKQTQDNIQKARKELVDTFAKNNTIDVNSKNVSNALTELFTVKPEEIENKFTEIKQQFVESYEKTKVELQNKIESAKIFKDPQELLNHYFGENSGVTYGKGMTKIREEVNAIVRSYREFKKVNDEVGMANELQKLQQILNNSEKFNLPEGQSWLGLPTEKDLNILNQIGGVLNKIEELAKGKEVYFSEEEVKLLELIKQKTEAQAEAAKNAEQKQESFGKAIENTGKAIGDTNNKTESLNKEYNKLDSQTKALQATFGGLASRIEHSVSALTVFNKTTQIIRNAIHSVEELDAAFTQIAIVSEQSNESAWKMFDSFNKLAKQYSITTKDLTEGAKLFYQQGLNAADTMKMVEASTVSAALGEVTMTEAANTLTAAIQGYNESAAVAMDYTDKIAMVGAVSAADFNELSAAMEKTASSAYTAGIDFDHLLGYLGKMIEVTREAPANLGTAMKTIIARFEDMKKDPMAILEDGVSANKVEAALATIGIALRDSEGEFRALQDVMDELGMKWESLTRNQQAYIATVAAGSRQQSRFLAMMNDYDRTLDLIAESQNSAGAAAQQYAIYQDSIAAAQARLSASWENFYSKIVDNDLIKFSINSLSNLVDVLSHIPPIITAIGATIGALQINQLIKNFGKLNNGADKTIFGLKELYDASKDTNKSFQDLIKTSPKIRDIFKGLTGGSKEFSSSLIGVIKSIGAFLAANWQIIAIAAVIGGAIAGISYLVNRQKKEYEEAAESIKNYNEQYEILKERSQNAKDLLKTYEELSNKISLTDEEQETLNSTIDELKEIYPELTKRTNEYGDAEITNIDTLKERIRAEEELAKIQKRKALEGQRDILKKDSNLWTESDISQIDPRYASKFFIAKDEKEQNEKYTKGLFTAELQRQSVSGFINGSPTTARVTDFVNNKYFDLLNPNEQKRVLEQARKAANRMIDYYNLSLDKINEGADWDIIKNTVTDISNIVDVAPIKIAEANKQMQEAQANLEKINYLDLAFLETNFSDNTSIYNSQKLISKELEEMFGKMDINLWENFLKNNNISINNPKELTDKIQEILDTVTEDNSIELKNLFKDFNEGKISAQKFFEQFDAIAEDSGNEAAKIFADSFGQYLGQQLNKEKEKYKQFLISSGIGETLAEVISGSLNLGEGQKLQNIAIEYNLSGNQLKKLDKVYKKFGADFTKELDENINESIANESVEEVIQAGEEWKEKIGEADQEIADIIANGKVQEAVSDIANDTLNKLVSAAENLFKTKDYSSLEAGEASKYYNTFNTENGNNFFEHANFDDKGNLQLDKYAQVIVAQEDLNLKTKEYYKQLENINKEIEIIGQSEDLASEEIEKQLDDLKKQKKFYEDAVKNNRALYASLREIYGITEETVEKSKEYNKALEESVKLNNNENEALRVSASAAKRYKEISDIANELTNQMQKIGQVSSETMDSLLAYGPAFEDFFVIDNEQVYFQLNETVKGYASAAEAVKGIARSQQEAELEIQRQRLQAEADYMESKADAYDELARIFREYAAKMEDYGDNMTESERLDLVDQMSNEIEASKQSLINADKTYNALLNAADKTYEYLSKLDAAYWLNIGKNAPEAVSEIMGTFRADAETEAGPLGNIEDFLIHATKQEILDEADRYSELAAGLHEAAANLENAKNNLKVIDPTYYDTLAEKLDSAGKEGKDAFEKIAKAIEDANKALQDLDNLLIEINRDLKDISVDYNPFTDLFEAWEHEWDYYYNIKRLIAQIGQQGQYIDNIISADYVSADTKVNAYHAKIGNVLSKMSANDAYIEALRAGMSQTAVELTEQYGQYYKVDPTTGQIYQTDKNLTDINNRINAARQEVYDLQKLQNEKENDLALENAKLDALEQEKSAYESILSTIESQLDSLEDNEDIIVDLGALKDQQASLKAKIEISDDSIDEVKDRVRSMEDEIQEIEVQITLNERTVSELEGYVDKMEDKVSEYEEYWETLNGTIAEQQELLQELYEIQQTYIDTAIDTQQQLYDAIVEQYQDEINEKKKQYDYLKQLDNEYLQSVKENIDKERQLREDSNKQKSYQQNLQRAQLLQMDTSGTYRTELANLKKDIEAQRQDLYDDLVDKQVKALEKEIEKRHELYDKEVAALEERLAYYQENAILLWEMVNSIVSEGAETMMATLENTTAYINSNELSKQQQRLAWANNIQMTLDGVKNGTINMLNGLIVAGNNYINNKLPEIGNSLDEYSTEFTNASEYINSTTQRSAEVFQGILDNFMATWNQRTNEFTAYAKNWTDITASLKAQTEKNLTDLTNLNERIIAQGDITIGSIGAFGDKVEEINQEMYDDFINERQRYRDELNSLIDTIRAEIEAAVKTAADAIRSAVAGLQSGTPASQDTGNKGPSNTGPSQPTQPTQTSGGSGKKITYNGYNFEYSNNDGTQVKKGTIYLPGKTREELWDSFTKTLENIRKKKGWERAQGWGFTTFKTGGLANFTGPAWLDGTKSRPEAVLNAKQTKLFTSMVSSLEKASNNSNINSALGSSYNIGDINTNINVERLDNETDIDKVARQVENRIMKSIRNRVSMAVA